MYRFGSSALWWGLLLVGGGALWLSDVTGVVTVSPFVVAIFFALAGLGFAVDFARDPRTWWESIPAGGCWALPR